MKALPARPKYKAPETHPAALRGLIRSDSTGSPGKPENAPENPEILNVCIYYML